MVKMKMKIMEDEDDGEDEDDSECKDRDQQRPVLRMTHKRSKHVNKTEQKGMKWICSYSKNCAVITSRADKRCIRSSEKKTSFRSRIRFDFLILRQSSESSSSLFTNNIRKCVNVYVPVERGKFAKCCFQNLAPPSSIPDYDARRRAVQSSRNDQIINNSVRNIMGVKSITLNDIQYEYVVYVSVPVYYVVSIFVVFIVEIPTRNTILRWEASFRITGSTLKKKSPGRNSIALRLSEATIISRSMTFLSRKESILSGLRTSHNLQDIAQENMTVSVGNMEFGRLYVTLLEMILIVQMQF
ncbi:hypothetical protein ANN_14665 [Periplaneta americana]|uniref:Uncharacterized protein n=1 Tax=Periplaneta americana TaxID=6978 RepID=A0ABQ8SWW8_PERAM|nr:hypothetical protein ANN_14665 [Periplaneta americana]